MVKNNILKNIIFFLTIFLINFQVTLASDISLELISDKQIYQVGENVNLTLMIDNKNSEPIQGQIKGKVIIGDIGYEIQCFDYTAPKNQTQYLGLNPLPASLSNSNTKTMSTLYACSGSQMQSTKTSIDNTPLSQSGEEIFDLGPFTYSYNLDGKDYEIKSNKLNITVKTSQEQQEKQENNENQESQEQDSPDNQNEQNPQTNQENQGLNQQDQQSLTNNQQNSQSVNQLKKDIQDAKQNPLDPNIQTEEKKSFWLWLFILLVIILILTLIYIKYFKKEEKIIKNESKKRVIPKYYLLLNKIKNITDEKEKAVILSMAIKLYIAEKNNLEIDLTHSYAIKFTTNKLFIELLKKTENIEFANKKLKINYDKIIKQLKGEFKNGN